MLATGELELAAFAGLPVLSGSLSSFPLKQELTKKASQRLAPDTRARFIHAHSRPERVRSKNRHTVTAWTH
jgi:hypothetical protein